MPVDTKISLRDFEDAAKENGCTVAKSGKEKFIGANGASTYPHIHVWRDGTIALSMASARNTKIGENEEINIDDLSFANDRCGWVLQCSLKETIDWVLRSAS
jgi:hypothetical protein